MTPTNITEQLIRDEGVNLSAYQDSLGFWTIGTGICIDARKGCGITADENALLLNNRIIDVEIQVRTQFPWTDHLDEVRLAVLWNMTFEMGISGLAVFKVFLGAMQAGNWPAAKAAMLDSVWAEEVPSRANRLAAQVITGIWQ